MEIIFEKGQQDHPVGHGFIYFKDLNDESKIYASYMVFLPIDVDISKYIPPLLFGQMKDIDSENISSFIFPPSPEIVKSLDWLNEISELRHDDLIFGGLINLNDIAGMMNKVKDCMEQYVDLYKSSIHIKQNNVEEIDYVVYGMLSEPDLLSELTTLIGRFRYAVEGNDKLTIDETSKKISSIGKYLPENRKIDLLLSSAQKIDESGGVLAQLYLERAYSLYKEDYKKVKLIEDRIGDFTS
mgnify:FL=1